MYHVKNGIEQADILFSLKTKIALSAVNMRRCAEYSYLKPLQYQSLKAATFSDSMIILPTGYGKSLIFELLPLLNNTQIIIVSPLNAIIEEQVSKFGADYTSLDLKLLEDLKKGKNYCTTSFYLMIFAGTLDPTITHENGPERKWTRKQLIQHRFPITEHTILLLLKNVKCKLTLLYNTN